MDFLQSNGLPKSAAALVEEGAVDAAAVKTAAGLLEKKWTSVLRLQKKVMQLEEENKQLKENSVTVKRPANMALPLAPALHVLKVRRDFMPRLATADICRGIAEALRVWPFTRCTQCWRRRRKTRQSSEWSAFLWGCV